MCDTCLWRRAHIRCKTSESNNNLVITDTRPIISKTPYGVLSVCTGGLWIRLIAVCRNPYHPLKRNLYRWSPFKSAIQMEFKRELKGVPVKKLESPEKWFLETQSSLYRWKRVWRKNLNIYRFEILFCSVFMRETTAKKSRKRSTSADKSSSR